MNNTSSTKNILFNDNYNYIAVNEIRMWVSNNGSGSHDPNTDGNGLYWPGGLEATKAASFEDGLVWSGFVNDSLQANGNNFRHGLQAGKILPDGSADNPDLPKYRVYNIRKDWESLPHGPERNAYEIDYYQWPVDDGAPWVDLDSDNIYTPGIDEPDFFGDEMLWYVSNDLDTIRTKSTYGSDPIGLGIQTMVYGYNEDDFLKDVLFKKYTLINKNTSIIDSMYLTYWTDVDLGDSYDDFVGCDTILNLGYTYNGDNEDGSGSGITYGTPPPAIGYMYIQGPIVLGESSDSAKFRGKMLHGYKNLPISSFFFHINASQTYEHPAFGTYEGTRHLYNNMNGLIWNGNPVIDPHTGMPVKFPLSGDPVLGEGWYEGPGWPGGESPGSRWFILTTGPLTMAPGDTQEVELAIFLAIGQDHIDSVNKLKAKAREIHWFFGNDLPSVVEQKEVLWPSTFRLFQNYPNPFNPTTTIKFTLVFAENVQIEIYNISGQKIERIINKKLPAGDHEIEFIASNLASGLYFYRMKAGSFQDIKKMILIK